MAGNPWYDSIQEAALSRCPALLYDWLPGGRVQGRTYQVANIHGGPGDSLKVNLDKGLWKDWSSGEPGGNLIGLYARTHNLEYKEAARELSDNFGIARPKPVARSGHWTPIVPIPDFAPLTDEGLPDVPARSDGAEISGAWCYLDREGQALCWRVRIDAPAGKLIYPLTFCRERDSGRTEWRWVDLPAPRPLFGLEMLAALPDAPVLIVEGEKTAEAAARLLPDWVVMTWPGGTNRVGDKHTDWSPIVARQTRIVLWPDNDPPGMLAISQLALYLNRSVEVVQPDPAWRKGWDLADAEAEGWDNARVSEWLENHIVKAEPNAPSAERPVCNISTSDLKLRSDAVWAAIASTNKEPELLTSSVGLVLVDRDVFKRGRRRVVDIPQLRNWTTNRIRFERFVRNPESGEPHPVPTVPNDTLLENLLVAGHHPVPFLKRLAEVPVFAPDGRLIVAAGFDESSGIYHLPAPGLDLTEIETSPEAVEAATSLIDDLLTDFPFVSDTDKAHAVAFALIPLIRQLIVGRVPLFRFEAPQPRTGKSLLMRLLAGITCMRVVDMPPAESDDEWRKRITASLALEPDAILFDNVTTLEFSALKEVFTAETWEDRPVHAQHTVRFKIQCAFAATVNNPLMTREMLGRSVRIRLDAHLERPEIGRAFQHPQIEEYARQNRSSLVGAFLTIALAGLSAETPEDAVILGGYEAFSRRLAAILANAGYKGFLLDRDDDSALDSADQAFAAFVEAWGKEYGGKWVTASWLLSIARDIEGLYLGKGDSDRSQQMSLGRLISQHRGHTTGLWTVAEPHRGAVSQYRLHSTKRENSPQSPENDSEDDETPF